MFHRIHHVAIICSDYARSKHFYVEVLGFKVVRETYREGRKSYKLICRWEIDISSNCFPSPIRQRGRRGLKRADCGILRSKWMMCRRQPNNYAPAELRSNRSASTK